MIRKLSTVGTLLAALLAAALSLVPAAAVAETAPVVARTAEPSDEPSTSESASASATASASVSVSASTAPSVSASAAVLYEDCADVEAAGAAPLHTGQPGYRPALDSDGDGVACETSSALPVTGDQNWPLIIIGAVLLSAGLLVLALSVAGTRRARRTFVP